MSNDTTNNSNASSEAGTNEAIDVSLAEVVHFASQADQPGFEMDVVHETSDAYLVVRIRLPRSKALPALIEMLTQKAGSGFHRAPPPASDD